MEKRNALPGRAEYIDIFRAYGIILMVMGHIGFGGIFDYFIHAFHMPMFFVVSGMFFKVRDDADPRVFLKKKVKTLLLPYAVFGIFHYLVWLAQQWPDVSTAPLVHLLSINTDGLPIAGALWFLTAFFFTQVMYFCIQREIKSPVVQHIVVAVISLFGCVAGMVLPFRLPYAMDPGFVGVGLLHIGRLLRQHMDQAWVKHLFALRIWEWLILAAVTTALIFVNGYINMRQGVYAIIPLFWVNAVLSVIVGVNAAQYSEKLLPQRINGCFAYIGRNSIAYLCLNQLALLVVSKAVNMLSLPMLPAKLLMLVLVMAVLHLCAWLLTDTKLKVVVGR